MTIVEFLTARLDEKQRHAEKLRAAMQLDSFNLPATLVSLGALVDPREVLADCEAKRAIVAEAARPVTREPHPFGEIEIRFTDGRVYQVGGPWDLDITEDWKRWAAEHQEPSDPTTLRRLAAIDADHPDYREEWRP